MLQRKDELLIRGEENQMAIRYVEKTEMDLGEKIRFRSNVKPACDADIPFEIQSASYELIYIDMDTESELLEDTGSVEIKEHTLETLIEPAKAGTYCLRYTYHIADEIWVDNFQIKVKG